jgi:hypothetical protein
MFTYEKIIRSYLNCCDKEATAIMTKCHSLKIVFPHACVPSSAPQLHFKEHVATNDKIDISQIKVSNFDSRSTAIEVSVVCNQN